MNGSISTEHIVFSSNELAEQARELKDTTRRLIGMLYDLLKSFYTNSGEIQSFHAEAL